MTKTYPLITRHFQGKARVVLGCLMLGAGLVSVPAADISVPASATTREADTSLPISVPVVSISEQKESELNRLQILPSRASLRLPVLIGPRGIEKKPHRTYAAVRIEKC